MDVAAWLHGLGLQQYEQAFCDNAIDATVLPELTAEDLKDLGVSLVGHRRKRLGCRTNIAAQRPRPDKAPTDKDRMDRSIGMSILQRLMCGQTGPRTAFSDPR